MGKVWKRLNTSGDPLFWQVFGAILIVLAALSLSGCSDEAEAKRILEAHGYSDIRLDGHAWFTCGDKENVSTRFYAKAPGGVEVKGAVCTKFSLTGWGKGNTIRID